MTEEYHTPKDLVNKQPLTIGLEVFKKNHVSDDVQTNGSHAIQRITPNSRGDLDKV